MCSSFSAEACAILLVFTGLGSTNNIATFLLFFTSSQTLSLSLCPCYTFPSSFLLTLFGASGRNYPFPPLLLLSDYNGSPVTHFFQGMARSMSCSSQLQSHVVSFYLILISTLLFSRTGGIRSHQKSLTEEFPQYPPRNLCFLIPLVMSSPIFGAMHTFFYGIFGDSFFLTIYGLGLGKLLGFSSSMASRHSPIPHKRPSMKNNITT